ncbi:hypothetical protein HP439_03955 [Sphingobacterium shayense]|uniref:hypothetical protein n=1 Tax=Sphingobacterium shayense TaxID=626343 RepID=UPI0015519587|nr:hypothetical protein [Sphingobacterium shayense]NQD69876.1 hypothetical protein [Sphingobacterium shayense]
MKVLNFIFLLGMLLTLSSCGNGRQESETTDNPGPVNEMDQSRYNLNSSEKSLYGTTDTLNQDSLAQDSLVDQDSLSEIPE